MYTVRELKRRMARRAKLSNLSKCDIAPYGFRRQGTGERVRGQVLNLAS
ncbi:MAG: hypothetical protein ACP6KW_08840 [Candidatus Thorarchaeota archaeon]